ncbi:hypothetical protein J9B83_06120 [Marinomonas sp. A79]|uniref:Uncharacterized protein n=1 Tax=Marinomonas vulgaris TaxID=2823372 RepID=A0ABS5HAW2_9GAMM|nr:hypothetical protein [Marinomonas vulgaris]MBR7888514.1 hypothetical protein [Marinomonas vulgaris]
MLKKVFALYARIELDDLLSFGGKLFFVQNQPKPHRPDQVVFENKSYFRLKKQK